MRLKYVLPLVVVCLLVQLVLFGYIGSCVYKDFHTPEYVKTVYVPELGDTISLSFRKGQKNGLVELRLTHQGSSLSDRLYYKRIFSDLPVITLYISVDEHDNRTLFVYQDYYFQAAQFTCYNYRVLGGDAWSDTIARLSKNPNIQLYCIQSNSYFNGFWIGKKGRGSLEWKKIPVNEIE